MKRLLAAALGAMALALAACGGDDAAPLTQLPGATATAPRATVAATASGNQLVDAMSELTYPQELADGTRLGKKDAPAKLLMFEDFTCSHCLEFTANLEPGIIDELVKSGKVLLEFHFFPLRQSSAPPMAAAQCAAEQNRFWDYQKRLFTEQAIAGALPTDKAGAALALAFGDAKLKDYARELGLDPAKFNACYAGDAPMQVVQADLRLAQKYLLKGTPGFVLNDRALASGYPATVADWKKLIETTK